MVIYCSLLNLIYSKQPRSPALPGTCARASVVCVRPSVSLAHLCLRHWCRQREEIYKTLNLTFGFFVPGSIQHIVPEPGVLETYRSSSDGFGAFRA